MKIMTFNTQHCLNYIEQVIDFDIMAKAITDCGADIVGLNEMRDEGVHHEFIKQTKILAEKTGLENYYFAKAIELYGEENPYGNGIISRYKIVEAKTIPVPDPVVKLNPDSPGYETRCLLKVKLENGLTVLVTHFGLHSDEQENSVKTILENLEDEKCILMGDFNVTPDSPLLNPIREKMKDTADLFDKELYSHPSDDPVIKIDYIFVSKDIEVVAADIPAIVASDHRPHTAEIKK